MQITIDLLQDLEQALIRQATQSNIPLQSLNNHDLRQLAQSNPGGEPFQLSCQMGSTFEANIRI